MDLERNQRGQALVVSVLFMTVLMGMAAMVLDVGSWFRQHRRLQATVDAAALAAAQELPSSPGNADTLARRFADRNTPGLTRVNVSFETRFEPNDTVRVRVEKPAPGIFAKAFGLDSVDVGANAAARTGGMQSAKYVAPITVNILNPLLAGSGCPCFGPSNPSVIPLGKTGAPGAFHLVNLDGTRGGTGPPILADWILKGYQDYLPLGGYFSDPGAKFNSSQVQDALRQRLGTELLFPVYDTLTGDGANAEYHVIGWVAFHLEGVEARGNDGELRGYFTEVVWDGLQATTPGGGGPNFGARTVELID